MHVLVFKVWLATSFCLLFPLCHMVPEAECHSTEIVSHPSHTSASHQTSWVAGAADRLVDNPGQGEGEVTPRKSWLLARITSITLHQLGTRNVQTISAGAPQTHITCQEAGTGARACALHADQGPSPAPLHSNASASPSPLLPWVTSLAALHPPGTGGWTFGELQVEKSSHSAALAQALLGSLGWEVPPQPCQVFVLGRTH